MLPSKEGTSLTSGKMSAVSGITLVVLVAIASYPVFTSSFMSGHDLTFHLARIASISSGLSKGMFPVQLYEVQAFGFGYPTGLCYPDAFLYIPAALMCVGLSLHAAYIVFVVLVNAATAVIAWYSFSRVFGSRKTGLALSVLWTLAPYRICCIYVRAAMGEYLAITFVPLIVLGLWRLFLDESTAPLCGWIPLALGMAGTVLSHVLSVALFGMCGAVLLIPLAIKRKKRGAFIGLGIAIVVAVLLSAIFTVPFLQYYMGHDLRVKHTNINATPHSIEPAQLFAPFFRFAGGSAAIGEGLQAELPLGLGWGLLSALPLAALLLVDPSYAKKDTKVPRLWIVLFAAMSIVAMFASTYLFPWRLGEGTGLLAAAVRAISTIQFPWRLLGVASVMLALLLGVVVAHGNRRVQMTLLFCCGFALLECGMATSTYLQNAERVSMEDAVDNVFIGLGEYLPPELDRTFAEGWADVDAPIAKSQDVLIQQFARKNAQSAYVELTNKSDAAQEVLLPLFWHNQLAVHATQGNTDGKSAGVRREGGYVSLVVGPGFSGGINVEFVEPLAWRVAEALSILTAIALVIYAVITRKTRRASVATDRDTN